MNKERPEERDAKNVLEGVMGVELEHADNVGGVDHRLADRQHAVEITRFTTVAGVSQAAVRGGWGITPTVTANRPPAGS